MERPGPVVTCNSCSAILQRKMGKERERERERENGATKRETGEVEKKVRAV